MRIAFFTGAGISASAGIPTYRDGGSSWVNKDLEAKSHYIRYGNHLDELWVKHWGPLVRQIAAAEPTKAHKVIAGLEQDHDVLVVTQNVDDLHEAAGSTNVIHLHGTMDLRCLRCNTVHQSYSLQEIEAPLCPSCGVNRTRPDVVLFGEDLRRKPFKKAEQFMRRADMIVVVGSSLWVEPAASLVTSQFGTVKRLVLVNAERIAQAGGFDDVWIGDADDLIGSAVSAGLVPA